MKTYQSSRVPKTVFIGEEKGKITEVVFHSPFFTPKQTLPTDKDFKKKFEMAYQELIRANQSEAKDLFLNVNDQDLKQIMKKILSARAAELSRKAADLFKFLSKDEEKKTENT